MNDFSGPQIPIQIQNQNLRIKNWRWIISAAYGALAPSYSAPAPSYAAAPATGYDAANRYYVSGHA